MRLKRVFPPQGRGGEGTLKGWKTEIKMWFLSFQQETEGRGGDKDLETVTFLEERRGSRSFSGIRAPSPLREAAAVPAQMNRVLDPTWAPFNWEAPRTASVPIASFHGARKRDWGNWLTSRLFITLPGQGTHRTSLSTRVRVSCQHNPLCLIQHKSGRPHSLTKKGNDGRKTRARARDQVTFGVEQSSPGTLSKRPATAGRSQLCPSELSPSSRVTSAPPYPPSPRPGHPPQQPSGWGSRSRALPAAPLPPSAPSRARSLPPQRRRREPGWQAFGLRARTARAGSPQAADARVRVRGWHGRPPSPHKRTGAHTPAPPSDPSRKSQPLRLPAQAGCPQPAKGQPLPGRGVHSRPAGDLSPPRLPAPRVPAAAHLALAAREGRGPGVALASAGLVSPPPVRVAAPRSARSAALLRGASAAGGWRLSGRQAGRALSSPGRSEATAAAAGGGFLRCCPSRFPRSSPAGTPAPPPPPPRLSVFRRLGAREGPSGLPGPPGVEWAHGSLLTLRERPHPVWSPQPSVLAPPFPNSAAPVMRVATEGRGGSGCVEGVFWEGGLPPGAADALSQEEKWFSRRLHLYSECSRLIARLLSLSSGRRRKGPKRELGLGDGGSKPLGLCMKGSGGGGGGRMGTKPNRPGSSGQNRLGASWTSTPSGPPTPAGRSRRLPARGGSPRACRDEKALPPAEQPLTAGPGPWRARREQTFSRDAEAR